MIAWSSFTPLSALAGGVLIGVAAALLLAFNGRIAGISGLLGGLLWLASLTALAVTLTPFAIGAGLKISIGE